MRPGARLWPWIILALGVLLVVSPKLWVADTDRPAPASSELSAALPSAARFVRSSTGPAHYVGLDAAERRIGVVFRTTELPPRIRGYVDEIDLLVGVDLQGHVVGLSLLHHDESPAYMAAVLQEGYLQAWVGRPAWGRSPPDAVTGASVSCDAIERDLSAGGRRIGAEVLKLPAATLAVTPAPFADNLRTWLRTALLVALILLAFVGALRPGLTFLRGLSLALSVVLVGLLLDAPLGLVHAAKLLRLHPPDPSRPDTLLLLAACAAPILLGTNVYCDRLCPFRALQEACRRALPGRSLLPRPSGLGLRWARRLRPWLTLVALAAVLGLQLEAPLRVEPWVGLFSGAGRSALWLAFVALVLLASAWAPGLWCKGLCPSGALLDGLVWLRRQVASFANKRAVPPVRSPLAPEAPRTAQPVRASRARAVGLLLVWLVVLGLGLAQALQPPATAAAPVVAMERFDVELVREAIQAGHLVAHPARWARPLDDPATGDAGGGAGEGALEHE